MRVAVAFGVQRKGVNGAERCVLGRNVRDEPVNDGTHDQTPPEKKGGEKGKLSVVLANHVVGWVLTSEVHTRAEGFRMCAGGTRAKITYLQASTAP